MQVNTSDGMWMSRPNSVAKGGGGGGGCLEGLVAPWTPSSFNQFGDFCLATLYLFHRKKKKKKADILFVRSIPRVRGIRAHLSARFIFLICRN